MKITDEQKKVLGFLVGGIMLGALLTSGIFITNLKKKAVDVSDAVGIPFVKVDGQVYSDKALPGDASMEYYMLKSNIYNAKQNFANQLALRIALAKDAQKTVDASSLPKLNELLPISHVTESEARQYYDNIVKQMGAGVFGGQKFEQLKSQLMARLDQQKGAEVIGAKVQELQNAGRIEFLLDKPTSPSISLDLDAYPTRGNQNSLVTLVEVSDYLCPHCREMEPVVETIYNTYKDKIKFVSVSFPLAPAGLSGALSRGAYCANKIAKDKFWKYHELSFQVPMEKTLAPQNVTSTLAYFNEVVVDIAKNAGYEPKEFMECIVSNPAHDYLSSVQTYFNEARGFQGTPTFYLNNKLIQVGPAQLEPTIKTALQK